MDNLAQRNPRVEKLCAVRREGGDDEAHIARLPFLEGGMGDIKFAMGSAWTRGGATLSHTVGPSRGIGTVGEWKGLCGNPSEWYRRLLCFCLSTRKLEQGCACGGLAVTEQYGSLLNGFVYFLVSSYSLFV
ncbi:hypothetical protein Salat_2771100 [Sesamum alatum]|uniref:Uncharacterized protein n=1 Tax=Sesamum alatum TaxID=300844 RepID=A0AAE2C929_9LAMI|nr:hypothetical protein Salat_2771100 [Sesamum alatum]